MPEGRILVIDDEPTVREILVHILREEGYRVVAASSAREGLDLAAVGLFDVALVDIVLPDESGIEVLRALRAKDEELKVLVITGYPALDTATQAHRLGAFDYLMKPLKVDRVLLSVRNALEARRLAQRNRQLLGELRRANAVLGAINEVFRRTLQCESEREVAYTCLELSRELTESELGLIAELDETGRLESLAIGMDQPALHTTNRMVVERMEDNALLRRIVMEGTSVIANDLTVHPGEWPTIPHHPVLRSFLGVPLVHGGNILGLIALANKPSGYGPADQEAVEALSAAFVEALNRKRSEEALRASEERYRGLFERVPVGLYRSRPSGRLLDVNQAMVEMLGYPDREALLAVNVLDLYVDPEDHRRWRALLERQEEVRDLEMLLRRYDGTVCWGKTHVRAFHDADGRVLYYEGSLEDVTGRRRAEAQLRTSLREKEVLLQEIHHRVKNNLQVISSLLYLQSRSVEDESVLAVLQDSRSRVRSMALVHEKLYESPDLAHIDFADYVRTLVDHLIQSYEVDMRAIRLRVNVAKVLLGIDTAIPCGLIIHELVSNALKHAFPQGGGGEIHIELSREDNRFTLTVSDNGVGLPEGMDFRNSGSLGLQLVNTLVEQLEGTIELDRSEGTRFTIVFVEPKQ